MQKRLVHSIARALSVVAIATTAAAQPYAVIELPPATGQSTAFATDLNNRLQIVGTSGDDVVVWDNFSKLAASPAPPTCSSARWDW